MDSRLDSLFRTTLQPARETDTRQGIRRGDHQEDGRKKHSHHQEQPAAGEEELATLSLVALHEFLKGLLQQAGENSAWTIAQILPADEQPPDHPPPDQAAASAARAYQATARAAPGQSIDFSDHPPLPPPAGPQVPLGADDLRLIHGLITDIEALGRRGIAAINLHPADNFLQSLVAGLREAGLQGSGNPDSAV